MKLNYKRTILIGLAFMSICIFWQLYENLIPLMLKQTFHMGDTLSGAIMAMDNVLAIGLSLMFYCLKSNVCVKVYNTVMAKKPANSLYLFTSSDKRALKMMRLLHPDVDLLLIISKPICEETILEAIDMGIKRLGCRIEGTSKAMVDLAHKAGLYVSLWPGQSPEEFMRGAYLGADALNSDRAVEVKNWLDKNAPWIKYK